MKILKKIPEILIVLGVIMIIGKMGRSDLYNLSFPETVSGILPGAAVCSLGKPLAAVLSAASERKIKCKKIYFVKSEDLKRNIEFKKAV